VVLLRLNLSQAQRTTARIGLWIAVIGLAAPAAALIWSGPGDYVLLNRYFESSPLVTTGQTKVERVLIEGPFAAPDACFAEMRRLNQLQREPRSATAFSCERLRTAAGMIDNDRAHAFICQRAHC
jgi:hypothetical protein